MINNVLITGFAGFIGSSFVEFLNNKGIIPYVYDPDFAVQYKNLIGLKYHQLNNNVNYQSLYDRFHNFSHIIHLGAHSQTNLEPNNENYNNNVSFTQRLVKCSPGSKHIFASSASIYGNLAKFTEDLAAPESFYAFTKRCCELENSLNFCSLRFFNVFGHREFYKGDMASPVDKWLTTKEKQIKIYQQSNMARDFIHVDDICEIIWFFMKGHSVSIPNGIYNAGTGVASKWTDIANIITSYIGYKFEECHVLPESLKNNYQYYTCADLTKLRSVGFDHKFLTLEEGIKRTYEKLKV